MNKTCGCWETWGTSAEKVERHGCRVCGKASNPPKAGHHWCEKCQIATYTTPTSELTEMYSEAEKLAYKKATEAKKEGIALDKGINSHYRGQTNIVVVAGGLQAPTA